MIHRLLPVAAVAALLLAACSSDQTTEPAAPTEPVGSVSISTTEPAQLLLPAMAAKGAGDAVDAMWTGLVDYDPVTAQPRLAHAESIETRDNRVWRVTLKPGGPSTTAPRDRGVLRRRLELGGGLPEQGNQSELLRTVGRRHRRVRADRRKRDGVGDISCPDQPVPSPV